MPGAAVRGRMAGIDIARALAVIGMLAVHVGPTSYTSLAGRLFALPHGRASILFVLVAGVGASLLATSRTRSLADARLRLVWVCALLLPGGLALQMLDHGILVVLQTYAGLFLLAIAVLGLHRRWLLTLSVGFAVLGPLVYLAGRIGASATFSRSAASLTDPGSEIVIRLVLAGPYPLLTWAAPFLFGMWLGRLDLGSSETRQRMIGLGAAAAFTAWATSLLLHAVLGTPTTPVGWDHLIVQRPHSQMPLWLIGATGSAVLVLGLCLVAADALGRIVRPLVAMGQLALTFYVAHLLALHWWTDTLTTLELSVAVTIVGALTVAALVLAVAWRSVLPRGPLEGVLIPPWHGQGMTSASPRSGRAMR